MDEFLKSGAGAAFILLGILSMAIVIVVAVFFLLTLRKALSRCQPQNRAMSPNSVWWMLVPIFNVVWQFYLYIKIAESLEREFQQRSVEVEAKPGRTLGIFAGICSICSVIPVAGMVISLVGFICWVVFWVKVSNLSSQIADPIAPQPIH